MPKKKVKTPRMTVEERGIKRAADGRFVDKEEEKLINNIIKGGKPEELLRYLDKKTNSGTTLIKNLMTLTRARNENATPAVKLAANRILLETRAKLQSMTTNDDIEVERKVSKIMRKRLDSIYKKLGITKEDIIDNR
jgi:hypothetical protein